MAAEVRAGLLNRPLPRLPSKYFYDDRGSALFEQITQTSRVLPDADRGRDLGGDRLRGRRAARPVELCELGSGSGARSGSSSMPGPHWATLRRCVLMDVNASVVAASIRSLKRDYPALEVRGVVGDFQYDLAGLGPGGGRLALLLAGTIGNLHPDRELPAFLNALAQQLAPGDGFLVGVDLVKDEGRLHAAYNDAAGVTAEFNRNILRVVNAALDADFDPMSTTTWPSTTARTRGSRCACARDATSA
jgi:L-histidine N-alpha-methyltransferase